MSGSSFCRSQMYTVTSKHMWDRPSSNSSFIVSKYVEQITSYIKLYYLVHAKWDELIKNKLLI